MSSLRIIHAPPSPDTVVLEPVAPRAVWRAAKRGADISLSLLALLATLPLTIAIAIAIKLDSRGPLFYRVRRVGYRGRELRMLKFRKMHDGATGAPLTASADPRLTRVGAVLTRWRLDELPQFWDVLRGRMSIIGPRPEDPRFVDLHPAEYARILRVRPGIVGLSQLAYEAETQIVCGESPIEDYVSRIMPQKLILDQLYAARWSVRLDLSIIRWATVALFLRRPVAVNRTTGAMNVRRRREPWSRPALVDVSAPAEEIVAEELVAVAEAMAVAELATADAAGLDIELGRSA